MKKWTLGLLLTLPALAPAEENFVAQEATVNVTYDVHAPKGEEIQQVAENQGKGVKGYKSPQPANCSSPDKPCPPPRTQNSKRKARR